MRALRIGAAIVAALLLQATLGPAMARISLGADFGLVVVVFVGLTRGPSVGLLTGSVTGLAQDIIAGDVVGVSGLGKTVVGFLAGMVGLLFVVAQPGPRFVAFALATILDAACFAGLHALVDPRPVPPQVGPILVRALVNAVLGVGTFQAGAWVRRVRRRGSRRAARDLAGRGGARS